MKLNYSRSTVVLLVALCVFSLEALAERYSVEQDSFGGYSAKKVDDAQQADVPVIDSQPEPEEPQQQAKLEQPPEPPVSPKSQNVTDNEYLGDVGDSLSPFEKEYIETERLERSKVLGAIRGAPPLNDFDATRVNSEEFVDGDKLLIDGGRPSSEGSRYYTVVDADGTVRNIDYDADAVQAALEKEREKKIEFTEASVLEKSAASADLPESADPFAAALFAKNFTSDDYFDGFSSTCCQTLPNVDFIELELGKAHYYEMNEDQLPYRFSGGDSRFLLLSLPQTKEKQALSIRSFVRRHKRFGIDNGVFFPQLVTLDSDKQPLRIFTGPLLKYHSETWLAHGYLEGFFQLDSTKGGGERFLLVNTTRDILGQTSSIESDEELISIEHMEIGTLELKLLVEDN